MICPRCGQSITYRERNNNQCSKCYKEFAFEPKTHPLRLTDTYFSKVVEKLSDNGKLFFTPQQLHYALSRKKLKSSGAIVGIIILGVVISIITLVFFAPAIFVVVPLFIIFIIAQLVYFRKFVSLPQTFQDFQNTVVYHWKRVYGEFPKKLIINAPKSISNNYNLRGILFCETEDTVNFIIANQLNIKFGLAVFTKPNSDFSQLPKNLPIYVLHDASGEGSAYLKKIKDHFGQPRQVIDLGLRPQSVINSRLMKFRQTNYQKNNFSFLTQAENDWLNQGYYTPLFVLRPARLIQYLTKQIERRDKPITAQSPEKQAQAIGFMTWVGEK